MPEAARSNPDLHRAMQALADVVVHEPSAPRELRYRTMEPMSCAHTTCDTVVPEGGFVWRNKSTPDFFCCSDCRFLEGCRQRTGARYRSSAAARAYQRDLKLQAKYGITLEEWDDLYDQQLGRCAVCLVTFGEETPHTDHCHETGRVRGLLCGPCNVGLGMFKDDSDALMRAIAYLRGGDV